MFRTRRERFSNLQKHVSREQKPTALTGNMDQDRGPPLVDVVAMGEKMASHTRPPGDAEPKESQRRETLIPAAFCSANSPGLETLT
jgi:hypothetical protein